MSNDIINHLDAREKELWAELEKIDATRKLWQESAPVKATTKPRRAVQMPIRKLVPTYDPQDLSFVISYLGGVEYIRQCMRNSKNNECLRVAKFGEKGFRIVLHNYGARSKTGKTEKKSSIGYYGSFDSARAMRDKIVAHVKQFNKNN